MSQSTARFKSDTTIYTPHGLGVAYSNTNLTDKAARDILKNDPDAAGLFEVLPSAVKEQEQNLTPAQASAEKQAEKAEQPAQTISTGFDYAKLASAMVDEMERRTAAATADASQAQLDAAQQAATVPVPVEQPALTASAGGAADTTADVTTDTLANGVQVTTGQVETVEEKRVRLSRMSKEQLQAAYRSELQAEPADALTNDQLRQAISDHRVASVSTPDATTSLV